MKPAEERIQWLKELHNIVQTQKTVRTSRLSKYVSNVEKHVKGQRRTIVAQSKTINELNERLQEVVRLSNGKKPARSRDRG